MFSGQRIPMSSCVRKEAVDIDILTACTKGDRKIMQPIRVTSGPDARTRKWTQFR